LLKASIACRFAPIPDLEMADYGGINWFSKLSDFYGYTSKNLLDPSFRGNDQIDPIGARHAGPDPASSQL
jgi:hypothetical protein